MRCILEVIESEWNRQRRTQLFCNNTALMFRMYLDQTDYYESLKVIEFA